MGLKTIELEPTKANILKTIREDLLDRNESVWRFARFCDAQDGSCSIAIDAKWGEGKTFFVKQTQMLLEAYNQVSTNLTEEERTSLLQAFIPYSGRGDNAVELEPHLCVYYDAWTNDNDVDPMLSLIYSITKSVACDYKANSGIDVSRVIAGIFDFFTGKNAKEMVEMIKERDILSDLKQQKDIHELVAEFLDKLMEERGNRLLIIIDELDRCKPSYAVCLLERMKHYFNNDRITFVFSINTEQLQHTIKRYYGNDFDACRYLDRFFDYRISLPPPNKTKYFRSIGLENDGYVYETVCKTIINRFAFSLRETEKFYRSAKIAAYKQIQSNRGVGFSDEYGWRFTLCIMVPLIIGLRMKNTPQYTAFIEGKDASPLLEVVTMNDDIIVRSYGTFLLGENESYSEVHTDKVKVVKLSEKLTEAYNALFANTGKSMDVIGRYNVGKCAFSSDMKDKAILTASMLSRNAMYE